MASDNVGRLAPAAETPRPDNQSGVSPISVDVFDTTFRSFVVVDFDVAVVVTIAMLLESNKCFFAISTDTSLHELSSKPFSRRRPLLLASRRLLPVTVRQLG
jgi:hypothetical protein